MAKPHQTTPDHYVVILCGGTGPRLWPLSTSDLPKQFLTIFGHRTLFEQALARAKVLVPDQNIFIVTNKNYLSKIKTLTSDTPKLNLISEPAKRNTALAILYATSLIQRINPRAVISALPSDHLISPQTVFKSDMAAVFKEARTSGSIVTLGFKPTLPNPSLGYIKTVKENSDLYRVVKFIEKPLKSEAQSLIKNPQYFWNVGIYTFSISALINAIRIHNPGLYQLYLEFHRRHSLSKIYASAPNLSFDIAVSEKTNNMKMLPAHFNWADVGEWQAIFFELQKSQGSIAIIDKNTNFIETSSQNCLVNGQADKLIGLVGLNNIAVIDTKNALLVCNMDHSFEVRRLVAKIVSNPKTKPFFLKPND